MDHVDAYPLSWPDGFPRTEPGKRQRAQFSRTSHSGRWPEKVRLSISDALRRLSDELERLGTRDAVVSSNVPTRLDGLPRSGARAPDDPGVAVYFHLDGKPHCMPCDRWDRVADNIAAVAATIAAQRGIERWGVGDVARAFAGFQALPPPDHSGDQAPWIDVLGLRGRKPTLDEVEQSYRDLARRYHPDAGFDPDVERMAEVNRAVADARRALV